MTKARDLSNIIEAGGNLNVTGDLTSTNITATGYIAGPATFVIDPAAVGDNTGTLVVAGNLQVDGTTTTINSTTMTVNDLNITLASGAENSAAANGAGLTVDGASATLLYTNLSDSWSFNKNVGIGTSSPSSYNTNFNDLVIDGGTNSGVTVVSGTTGDGTIAFADGTTGDEAYRGYIQYTHAGEDLKFGAAGAERMRLDASGNVGIGCTPDTALNAFGYTVLEVAGATTTKSGAILLSNSSGTDFGQIYADNADGWKFVNGQTTKSTIFYGGSGTSEQMRIDASGNVTIKSGLANGGGVLNLENTDLAVNGQDWGSVNFISNDSSTSASGIRASIVGTSTSFNGDGNLVFSTAPSNGVNTERMRIDASGNVKIGDSATDITSKLVVSGNASADVATFMYDGAAGTFLDIDCGAANGEVTLAADARSGSYPPLVFKTSATPSMTLDASGNLGLGTSTNESGYKLDVRGWGHFEHPSGDCVVAIRTGNNTGTSFLYFGDQDSVNPAYVGYNHTSDSMSFKAGGSLAMTLDASGNLLVGTTNSSVSVDVGIKLRAGSDDKGVALVSANSTSASEGFTMWSTGANAWRFYVGWDGKINATSNTIQAISDQRFKENIRDLDDGLSKVMQLKPRKFDWKEGKGADTKNARGFIAQEFEEVFPDLIGEWKDPAPEGEEPYKSVSQDLIPTLVKAIQEQQEQIEQLKADIAVLKGAN